MSYQGLYIQPFRRERNFGFPGVGKELGKSDEAEIEIRASFTWRKVRTEVNEPVSNPRYFQVNSHPTFSNI